eukprot:COSAG02_NODE_176_length_31159_cov_30.469833_4_plen_193_part_00
MKSQSEAQLSQNTSTRATQVELKAQTCGRPGRASCNKPPQLHLTKVWRLSQRAPWQGNHNVIPGSADHFETAWPIRATSTQKGGRERSALAGSGCERRRKTRHELKRSDTQIRPRSVAILLQLRQPRAPPASTSQPQHSPSNPLHRHRLRSPSQRQRPDHSHSRATSSLARPPTASNLAFCNPAGPGYTSPR